jgi:hypothetical protein
MLASGDTDGAIEGSTEGAPAAADAAAPAGAAGDGVAALLQAATKTAITADAASGAR